MPSRSASIPKLEPKIDLENTRELTADDKVKFIKLINALTNEQVGQVVTTLESRCPASLNEVVRVSRARRILLVLCSKLV